MRFKRPLLFLAFLFVSGEALVLSVTPLSLRILLFALLLSVLLFAVRSGKLRISGLLLSLLLLLPFMLYSRRREAALFSYQSTLTELHEFHLLAEGQVEEYIEGNGKSRFLLREVLLSSAYGDPAELPENASPQLKSRYLRPVGKLLILSEEQPALISGQKIRVYGRLLPLSPPTNEGQFNVPLYFRSLGISGSLKAEALLLTDASASPFQRLLASLRRTGSMMLRALYPPESSGLYQALLLGSRLELSEELLSLFRAGGIAHILAISGLHLSILGSGCYRLLRLFRLSHPLSGLLSGALILGYGILTGASGSALRAVFMLLLSFLSLSLGRSYDPLSALSAACLLLLLFRPLLLLHSGFQLSFGAALALSLSKELPCHEQPVFQSLLSAFFLQLCLLPLTLYHYFQIPVFGLLLNFLILPLLPFLVGSGLLALFSYALFLKCSFSPLLFLAQLFSGSGQSILRFYSFLCEKNLHLPFSRLAAGRPPLLSIFLFYLLLFLFFLCIKRSAGTAEENTASASSVCAVQLSKNSPGKAAPSPSPALCLAALLSLLPLSLFLLRPPSPKQLEITALDAGQGDSMVLRFQGRVLTMDGGSSSDRQFGKNILLPYLLSQGISRIDAAILSHCDSDHSNGILYLLAEDCGIRIASLLLPAPAMQDRRYDELRTAARKRGAEIHYLSEGDELRLKNEASPPLVLDCLYPENSAYLEDANSHSTGILLRFGDFRMLFTGDMSKENEQQLLNRMRNFSLDPKLTVLKAAHHGSDSSSSEALLRLCRPDYALLSYGKRNSYGHPHAETLKRLENAGTDSWHTALNGAVRIWTDGRRMRVEGYLNDSRKYCVFRWGRCK